MNRLLSAGKFTLWALATEDILGESEDLIAARAAPIELAIVE